MKTVLRGSSVCPICGHDKPHEHLPHEIVAYTNWQKARAAAIARVSIHHQIPQKAADERRINHRIAFEFDAWFDEYAVPDIGDYELVARDAWDAARRTS